MRVGVLCSAHGFGHTGRQLPVVARLLDLDHEVVLYSAASPDWVHGTLGPRAGFELRAARIDVGIVQSDSLTEDVEATVAAWEAAVGRVDALADTLRGLDAAVVDIAPTGLEACRRAGVPALAVGNFDWAWVYARYPALAHLAPTLRGWHAGHPALALAPGPGLEGFGSVRAEPRPLAGPASAAAWARTPGTRRVLAAFGGLGLDGLDAWLPPMPGVEWVLAPPTPRVVRPDVRYAEGVPFGAVLASVDAVLTKPGYGILCEAMAAGVRLCWLDRGRFPEAPYLEGAMRARGDVKVRGGPEGVAAAITEALRGPTPAPVRASAVDAVVDAVLALRAGV